MSLQAYQNSKPHQYPTVTILPLSQPSSLPISAVQGIPFAQQPIANRMKE